MEAIQVELKHPSVRLDHLLEGEFPRLVRDFLKDAGAPSGKYLFLLRGSKDIAGKKAPKKKLWGFDVENSGKIIVHAKPFADSKTRYVASLIPPDGVDSQVVAFRCREASKREDKPAPLVSAFKAVTSLPFPGNGAPAPNGQPAVPAPPAPLPPPLKLAKLAGCARKKGIPQQFIAYAERQLGVRREMTVDEAREIFKDAFDFPRTKSEKGIGRVIGQFVALKHLEQTRIKVPHGTQKRLVLPGPAAAVVAAAAAEPAPVVLPTTTLEMHELYLMMATRMDKMMGLMQTLADSLAIRERLRRMLDE